MTRTVASSDFGTLFSTVASLTSAVQGERGRTVYRALPQLTVRPVGRPWLERAVETVLTWSERARERRQLIDFDDHLLRDIGVTRAEVVAEAAKPFWRA